MKIKNKTAGHVGIACFSFALKGNRAGSPNFKIVDLSGGSMSQKTAYVHLYTGSLITVSCFQSFL